MKYIRTAQKVLVIILLFLSILHMYKGNELAAIWTLLMAFYFRGAYWENRVRDFVHGNDITIHK